MGNFKEKMILIITKYWVPILFVVIVIIAAFVYFNHRAYDKELIKELKDIKTKVKVFEKKNIKLEKALDSLSTLDTVYVDKIKIIKIKEYETIYSIDTLTVSELQKFFTDRYPERQ